MATRYVTLKDSNGDTLYPQAVATNLIDGSISQDKIDWNSVNKALLTYQPTQIPNNSDLNTPAFLKLGTYYVGTNNSASTISNSPSSLAFKMEVTSHGPSIDDETTNPWVRRFRILTDIDGNQWIQVAWAWGTAGVITYGKWYPILRKFYTVGDTLALTDGFFYMAGRQRVVSNVSHVLCNVPLDGEIDAAVSTITFTPNSYNEAFGPTGLLFSYNNPTSSQMSFSCTRGTGAQRNNIRVDITLPSASLTQNACCSVKLYGSFTFS